VPERGEIDDEAVPIGMIQLRIALGHYHQPILSRAYAIALQAIAFGIDDPTVQDSSAAYLRNFTPRSTLRVDGDKISTTSNGGFSTPRAEV
jgi:hypothetical protein